MCTIHTIRLGLLINLRFFLTHKHIAKTDEKEKKKKKKTINEILNSDYGISQNTRFDDDGVNESFNADKRVTVIQYTQYVSIFCLFFYFISFIIQTLIFILLVNHLIRVYEIV